jgi:hypothetical protein
MGTGVLGNIQPHQSARGTSPVLEPVIVSPLDEEPTDDWYDNWFDYAGDHENVKGFVR